MAPADRLAGQAQNRKMKVQDPNKVSWTGSVPPAARTTIPIIPEVRYHPSIQTQSRGDGGRVKSTSQPQKARPGVVRPAQTGTKNTAGTGQKKRGAASGRSSQVNPTPSVQRVPAAVLNSPEPAEPAADGTSQLNRSRPSGRAAVRPEEVPLGLGVTLKQQVVEEVELQTRGQRENPAWFAWRQNRITASTAHRIAHCRFVHGSSQTLPASYLAAITGDGPRVQTRAMSWGVRQEAVAVRRYQVLKSRLLGRPVTVRECGLFIDAQRTWLAASPDGIVTDSQTGQSLLCLEVKCPYKHRQRSVEEACRGDRAFCLEIQEEPRRPGAPPVYRLKPGHSYFTQIQCQLAVSGLRQADLVVFTLKETAIVPVTFDPDFWAETVASLEVFYRDAVLPHVRERRRLEAPAGAPEL